MDNSSIDEYRKRIMNSDAISEQEEPGFLGRAKKRLFGSGQDIHEPQNLDRFEEYDRKLDEINAALYELKDSGSRKYRVPRFPGASDAPQASRNESEADGSFAVVEIPRQSVRVESKGIQDVVDTLHRVGARIDNIKVFSGGDL